MRDLLRRREGVESAAVRDDLGVEPVGFDSSVAALQAFRAEPMRFDPVLTNETMPELTGTEFAREILKLRPYISAERLLIEHVACYIFSAPFDVVY